jgi:anti-anti-sigma factor
VGKALTIRVCREADYVLVRLAGEVDIATAAGLRERLWALAADGISLVADLDQVTFIDAAGLGALADVAIRAAAYGSRLHVVCARRQTRRLFRITGLDRRIPLTTTLAEGLGALARARGKAPVGRQWHVAAARRDDLQANPGPRQIPPPGD